MFKKKWYPPKQQGKYRPDFAGYEREKQAWIAHHPKATAQEYVEAMREIAARCRI
jgi:hypothetical protein